MTYPDSQDPQDAGNDGVAVGLFLAAILVIAGGCIAMGLLVLT